MSSVDNDPNTAMAVIMVAQFYIGYTVDRL